MPEPLTDTQTDLPRRLAAEAIGTALLLAIVVGSGIMAERLAEGNDTIALLGNTVATGAGLVVLIWMVGPVSGAHFNPAVTMAMLWRGAIDTRAAAAYVAIQIAAAAAGVWLAHAMFAEELFQTSAKLRDGWPQALSEAVATAGLIGTIIATGRTRPEVTPVAVGLYITSAYWFTASTSFANPAVTLARSLTDSFAGIAPTSVPLFLAGQASGTIIAVILFGWLFREDKLQ